jgi:signal transduction histidine kinase
MASERSLDTQAVLDGLGQGTLIFDSNNRMVLVNQAARAMLGTELRSIRSLGWAAALLYFNRVMTKESENLSEIRARALTSDRPTRFHIHEKGALVPCWAAAVHGAGGEIYTMITMEAPDWSALNDLNERYLREVADAVGSTQGHADLIMKTLEKPKANHTVEQVARRVSGFARIINVHMFRLRVLTMMMTRMHNIRTGAVRELVRMDRRKINLANFMEDFIETLDETPLVDPETEASGHRSRLKLTIPDRLAIVASHDYFERVLRDILRNAIMYSMRGTPIKIAAFANAQSSTVQVDVTDEGYGVRESEQDHVFTPFSRARQPQIISEFGYGLSMYLCQQEIEAMNGQLFFVSHEGVGSTFSIRLPAANISSSTEA